VSAFTGLARDSITAGANIIVHITNGNLFGKTAFSRQQNLTSVLRAVETGVPVVVASNTGPTQIISRTGRVIMSGDETLYKQQVVVSDVQISTNPTFYVRYGDIFIGLISCCVLLIPMIRLVSMFRLRLLDKTD
jgi:apolipoprotein N-acyltransferase